MTDYKLPGSELARKVAERYAGEGYTVDVHPQAESLPFDLGTYAPDIAMPWRTVLQRHK